MAVTFNTIKNCNVSFAGEMTDEKKKEAGKKIVTGGGVVGAAATASRFDAFKSAKSLSAGMKGITNSAKVVTNVSKQSRGIWAKAAENMKWAKGAILKWGLKFQNMRIVKYMVASPAFRGLASFLGYGFGILTLISGCSDIVKVTSDAIDGMKQ